MLLTRLRGEGGHERLPEGPYGRAQIWEVHLDEREVNDPAPLATRFFHFVRQMLPAPFLPTCCCAAVACVPPALEGSLSLGGSPLDAGSPPIVSTREEEKSLKKARRKQEEESKKRRVPFCERRGSLSREEPFFCSPSSLFPALSIILVTSSSRPFFSSVTIQQVRYQVIYPPLSNHI